MSFKLVLIIIGKPNQASPEKNRRSGHSHQKNERENLKSLRDRRDSPSIQVKPFELENQGVNMEGKLTENEPLNSYNILFRLYKHAKRS